MNYRACALLILLAATQPVATLADTASTARCIVRRLASPTLQETETDVSAHSFSSLRAKVTDLANKIDQNPSPDDLINLAGKVKSSWTGTVSLYDLPTKRKFGWIYGGPYFDQGRWWVDYLPNDSESRILKRMTYDQFLQTKLPAFKSSLAKGRSVLVPDPESKGSAAQFLIGTVTPLAGGNVKVSTANGNSFITSYRDLLFWNGHLTDDHASEFHKFFQAGGKGKIVRAEVPENPKRDGAYALLVDQLPPLKNALNVMPSLASMSAYDALLKAKETGVKVIIDGDVGGATIRSAHPFLQSLEKNLPEDRKSKLAVVIGSKSSHGVIEHELQHVSDFQHRNDAVSIDDEIWDALGTLHGNDPASVRNRLNTSTTLLEQRAYTKQLRSMEPVLSPQEYREKSHNIVEEFNTYYASSTRKVLDRLKASDPAAYEKLKSTLQKYWLRSDALSLRNTFPGHF